MTISKVFVHASKNIPWKHARIKINKQLITPYLFRTPYHTFLGLGFFYIIGKMKILIFLAAFIAAIDDSTSKTLDVERDSSHAHRMVRKVVVSYTLSQLNRKQY